MNSSRTFWGIFTLLVAVAAHLSYILFVPSSQLKAKMSEIAEANGINTLAIGTPGSPTHSLAEYPSELVYAVCPFDLTSGPQRIRATVPEQYWSLEVYNARGGTIYTLNDQQAPRRQFSLYLSEDDPEPQAIVNAANSLGSSANSITVLTGTQTGVVEIRSAAASPLEAARSMEALGSTSCEVVKN